MAADTLPDRVARITAREKSRSIFASKDEQRGQEKPKIKALGALHLCLVFHTLYKKNRGTSGSRAKGHEEMDRAHLAAAEGWIWQCICPRVKPLGRGGREARESDVNGTIVGQRQRLENVRTWKLIFL